MTMTDVLVTNSNEMRELTIDELEEAGGGLYPPGPTLVGPGVFHVFGVIINQ